MQQPGLLGMHKILPFSFHIHPTHTFSFIKQLPWVQVLIGLPNPRVMLLRTLVMNKRQREQDENDGGGLIQGRQRAAKVKERSQETAMSGQDLSREVRIQDLFILLTSKLSKAGDMASSLAKGWNQELNPGFLTHTPLLFVRLFLSTLCKEVAAVTSLFHHHDCKHLSPSDGLGSCLKTSKLVIPLQLSRCPLKVSFN